MSQIYNKTNDGISWLLTPNLRIILNQEWVATSCISTKSYKKEVPSLPKVIYLEII